MGLNRLSASGPMRTQWPHLLLQQWPLRVSIAFRLQVRCGHRRAWSTPLWERASLNRLSASGPMRTRSIAVTTLTKAVSLNRLSASGPMRTPPELPVYITVYQPVSIAFRLQVRCGLAPIAPVAPVAPVGLNRLSASGPMRTVTSGDFIDPKNRGSQSPFGFRSDADSPPF